MRAEEQLLKNKIKYVYRVGKINLIQKENKVIFLTLSADFFVYLNLRMLTLVYR